MNNLYVSFVKNETTQICKIILNQVDKKSPRYLVAL